MKSLSLLLSTLGTPRSRRWAVIVMLATLVALPAAAYRIYLKDGSTINAAKEYEVQGDKALIELSSGGATTIPLDEIDIARTRSLNDVISSDAILIENGRESSNVVIGGRQTVDGSELRGVRRFRSAAADEEGDQPVQLRLTPGGYPDLRSFTRQQAADAELARSLETALRSQGIETLAVFQGTVGDNLLVEIATDTPGDVFGALTSVSIAYEDLRSQQLPLTAIELVLQTSNRSRAGQFVLSTDNAPLLAKGRMAPETFFVEYVQF